ncbi:MAG TPA: helix-turn-helix domain-containing protein [Pseudolabrys sp.]|jgi:hypothetical protein|nr:helix-turn-helix domain-containing protein [Pseudolabrys sp.]
MAVARKNESTPDAQPLHPIGSRRRAFSIEEFCQRYPIGRTKAYEEIRLGRLRARKIGRRTIITADDAESWLQRLPSMKRANGNDEIVP